MNEQRRPGRERPFTYTLHPHRPLNSNALQKREQDQGGWNTRIAVWLTTKTGTMETAYIFALLSLIGLLALLGILPPILTLLVPWFSQTFLQLCLLPVIMVGQNVLSRKNELLAEQQFQTTEKVYHDMEQTLLSLQAVHSTLAQHDRLLRTLLHQQEGKET